MTMGFICDQPGCNTFTPGHQVATFEHRMILVDDTGETKPHLVSAHFCESCAIDLSGRLGLIPNFNGEEEDGGTFE